MNQITLCGETPQFFSSALKFTVFVIGDGDSDDVIHTDHGSAPVVTLWGPQVHLKLLLRLKHRVVVNVHRAVFHLQDKSIPISAAKSPLLISIHVEQKQKIHSVNNVQRPSGMVTACIAFHKILVFGMEGKSD